MCPSAHLSAQYYVCLSTYPSSHPQDMYLLSINFCIQTSIPNEIHNPPLSIVLSEVELGGQHTVVGGREGGGREREGGREGGKEERGDGIVGGREGGREGGEGERAEGER